MVDVDDFVMVGSLVHFWQVKTATLTLIIVAVLIVALSSVDAVLCYVLAVLLRRTA